VPHERLDKVKDADQKSNVYVSLQDLIKLQYEIRGFSFLPKQPVQSQLTGKHRSKLRGRGLDFDEVRSYAHGDDIRNIDWKVTARTQKPHTKTFTEERERPVFIIVDQSASMFFGSLKSLKSVTAAHIAALAGWKVLAVGDRVGGIVFDDADFTEIKPRRDRRAVQQFLKRIVDKNNQLSMNSLQQQNDEILNKVLQKTTRLVTHDYLLVIISDFSGFSDQTMKYLISLSRHNDIILAMVNDPMEGELPPEEVVISNGDMQMIAGTNDTSLKKRFKESFSRQVQTIRDQTKAYGITLLEFNTVDPASDQIRNMLTRGLPKRKIG
jgi:uncharacterized protein (DUF58 family)